MAKKKWQFYVYDILNAAGEVIYVGKGSGKRFLVSLRERSGASAAINAFFKREKDAYAHEVARIAEIAPSLNRHAGGNGSKAVRISTRKTDWERQVEKMGTRVYAARLLLAFRNGINTLSPKVDVDWSAIEVVVNGHAR